MRRADSTSLSIPINLLYKTSYVIPVYFWHRSKGPILWSSPGVARTFYGEGSVYKSVNAAETDQTAIYTGQGKSNLLPWQIQEVNEDGSASNL